MYGALAPGPDRTELQSYTFDQKDALTSEFGFLGERARYKATAIVVRQVAPPNHGLFASPHCQTPLEFLMSSDIFLEVKFISPPVDSTMRIEGPYSAWSHPSTDRNRSEL